ncbi:hypothetical protein [Tepidibacter aestuarii]|uniref:hypothetical protein n=1 Tax=Tepidibacter aestuarii TaxID=2925782 RepID=UPI0020C16DEC|nr:hypothetical protein [Tepidibacter aestuarii]CAH2213219.1 conserved protein of unknown function [Tepidibacter aestuarii]
MIKKEVFKKTEGMLYRYFKDKRDINMMQHKILVLENNKNKLEYILKSTHISSLECMNGDIKGISYESERVQTSVGKESYFEKALMKEIDNLERECVDINKKIIKLRIKATNKEARLFIDLKYGEGASFYTIADKLNISKSTAERRRGEIIEDIAKFYNFYEIKMGRSWDFAV